MGIAKLHPHIVQHPFASMMQGARLDTYLEKGDDLILEIQGLRILSSELFKRGKKIYEWAVCKQIPLKLTFSNVAELKRGDFFTSLENFSLDDPSRIIAYMFSWRQPMKPKTFYLFGLRGAMGADMSFYAGQVLCEQGRDKNLSITFERDWAPSPPMPDRLVPQPNYLYRKFGGDPITIRVNGQFHSRRLFIGSIENQPKYRPQVNAVLNLGEEQSRWITGKNLDPNDRSINKGEGSDGMTLSEIREEANWVIERLRKDQRVLVHCVAGMNRSTTICCAVLILLEGLSAEKALARVREHHPWARPDSHHWLALRWLKKTK